MIFVTKFQYGLYVDIMTEKRYYFSMCIFDFSQIVKFMKRKKEVFHIYFIIEWKGVIADITGSTDDPEKCRHKDCSKINKENSAYYILTGI